MSWNTTVANLVDMPRVNSGELHSATSKTVLCFNFFEDGLLAGRFAKNNGNQIENLDGSATPRIAGVVLRDVTNALENNDAYRTKTHKKIDVVEEGLVTIDVVDGESPQFGDPVFASNTDDDNRGKALTAGGEATNAEFIEEIKTNVWLIRLI